MMPTSGQCKRVTGIEMIWVSNKLALVVASVILSSCNLVSQADASLLNCLNPSMFKASKVGLPMGYGVAERANWYPQRQQPFPYQPGYMPQAGYGQYPMRLMLQPKWKGTSLFGSKGWGSWKNIANSNFYRPGYGYSNMNSIPVNLGYPISEQLNVAPLTVPNSISSYGSPNDGWSLPLTYNQQSAPIQQTQLTSYDSYSQPPAPILQPAKQQQQQVITPTLDPYGTKSGSNSNNKYTSTTTKNVLVADGGYDSYDAYLSGPKNQSYGYSYPDWYSGSMDSPAKIAQQLFKYGLRRQRLEQEMQLNRSANLILKSGDSKMIRNQFTILDEPRFVGFGTVDQLNGREARLSCSFNEAVDQTNRPLWVKFLGSYNSSQLINSKATPPFNCPDSQCRTQEIESINDIRYKFDNGPATTTLIISEPRLIDYGIYRCSALTRAINNNPLETIYQIVSFGTEDRS